MSVRRQGMLDPPVTIAAGSRRQENRVNVERGTGFGAERDQVTSCAVGGGARCLRRFIVATWRAAARSFFILLSPIEVLFSCPPSLVEMSASMFWLAAI
ncbi:protein of unknown function [Burkholderia multivorans]